MIRYVALGLPRDKTLEITGLTKHQYYYKPTGGKPGRPPTTKTKKFVDDSIVSIDNSIVVELICENHKDPDLTYGYRRMTNDLQLQGFIINYKKVYNLMKNHCLLRPKFKKKDKTYVKYRIVTPAGPLEVLEMDIKLVWIESRRSYAYILSVIDTFTRAILGWKVAMSITNIEVKSLWEFIIVNYLQPYDMLNRGVHIEIRNDNDPRFCAKTIARFFKENHLNQVFTHPYTPQENGHIESFHGILSDMLKQYSFWSLEQLEQRLKIFYQKYNNLRVHNAIANLPPMMFWHQWNLGNIKRIENDHKKVKFKLLIPKWKLSGIMIQKECSA